MTHRLLLLPILFACLVGGVLPTGLLAQIAPRELRTSNMELVGYNGEIAAKTPELIQLVVQGDYAYIGSVYGPAGLFIVDISDPRNPTLIAEFPQEDAETHDVKVNAEGTIAVLANQWVRPPEEEETWEDMTGISHLGLTLVDISEKRNPKLLSRWENHDSEGKPAPCHNVEIHDDFVYCTGLWWSDRGLVILDISDPTSPKEVAVAPTPEVAGPEGEDLPRWAQPGVYMHDIYLQLHPMLGRLFGYAAWWDAGLRVYDLTDPTSPLEVANWAWAELGPALQNTYFARPTPSGRLVVVVPALGAEGGSGFGTGFLSILDLSNPDRVELLSTWSIPGHDWVRRSRSDLWWTLSNFDVTEKRIYLANYAAGVWVIDISDPTDPYAVANFGPESFEPPPSKPEGPTFWGEGYPYVHTVEEQDGLVYALDAKSGLYVLRVVEER
ncbi:MAG: hypothetical protein IH951_07625 [Bacteroidetes bacterium]|nr:hypothetical protein [Bacteroidota bacterium]